MNVNKRVLPVIITHFVLGLLISAVYVFTRSLPESLIPPFVLMYRLRSILLSFIGYIPPLYISGLLIGFAIAFSKYSGSHIGRWSSRMLSLLTSSFVIMLVMIAFYVILAEGLAPVSRTRMTSAVARSEDYHEYLRIGREMLQDDDPRAAEIRALNALMIWADSSDAQRLLDESRYQAARKYGSAGDSADSDSREATVSKAYNGLTVTDAIDISEGASRELDFFDAHYYAMLAYRLSRPDDPRRSRALRMASDAWNQIIEGTDLLHARGDRTLYDGKMDAYTAMQQGDYLAAYYKFLALYTEDRARGDHRADPDLERFLEIARRGVQETFFFSDETEQLQPFESARDILFLISRSDGGTDTVSADGVVYTKTGGRDVVYLRGFEIVRHSQYHELEYHIRSPYVKMFAYSADGKNGRSELLLQSVDRTSEYSRRMPEVLAGEPSVRDLSVLLLDLPYRDFSLIVSANRGISSMNLYELLRFQKLAGTYGFDSRLYLHAVIERLSEPFILLILSVLALVAAWKYRLASGTLFKAWWILMVPLFSVLAQLVIQSVRFIGGVCIIYFIGIASRFSMLITLLFFAVSFTAAAIYFFAQRSD